MLDNTNDKDLVKVYFISNNNSSDNRLNIPIFSSVPSNTGSNTEVMSSNATIAYKMGMANDSLSNDKELLLEILPSSMDNDIIWTIICDLVGLPCLVSFLYILYRGIEVSCHPQ